MNESKLLEGAHYVDEPSFAYINKVFNYYIDN